MAARPSEPGRSVPPDLVELGTVRGAYGLKGWVRIAPLADGDVLLAARTWWLLGSDQQRAVGVEQSRRHTASIVAKWEGSDDKDTADSFRGLHVGVARSEFTRLPPGEFYWHDLIGLRVVNRGGDELGLIAGLGEHGQGQWLEVGIGGDQRLIPLVAQYVDAVDLDAGVVQVDWAKDW